MFPIGSIVSNTTKVEEILDAFVDLLEDYSTSEEHRNLIKEAREALAADVPDEELLGQLLDEVICVLGDISPPFTYVGAHEGDGACFGVWVDWNALYESDEVVKVEDADSIPSTFTGFVLERDEVFYRFDKGKRWILWMV